MQELYVDIGNSFIKAVRPEGVVLKPEFRCSLGGEKEFYSWLEGREEKITVCCVVKRIAGELKKRVPGERLHILGYRDVPPELINYKTPKTLGLDRFLTCYGAADQVSGAVVVVDAGSACTIDFMASDSVYYGGVIMPGLDSIMRSVLRELPGVPGADGQMPDEWPGRSTIDSLRWGTTGMFFAAIESFLEKFESRFGAFDLFVTGGADGIVKRHLSDRWRPKVAPFLLFEGMRAFSKKLASR